MRVALVAAVTLGLAIASPAAEGASIRGLVYDDTNGDGQPTAGEPGIANAVVALGVSQFTVTDASGQFTIERGWEPGIVWVRVPDGFVPGPVWAAWDPSKPADVELPLHRRTITAGALTFAVAADTHLAYTQEYLTAADLATAAASATALDPPPAFFTILGDITQANRDPEFDLVDAAVRDLGVPFIPVPGNHDWYDGGEAWFRRYGPDNYSFDIDGTHFVVWNMAMSELEIRKYLGAELARVDRSMTIIALTHAPPSEGVVDALRDLGVDYLLTGHAHSNRVVDHGGVIELNTEPLLMGGLDFTPAGYRVLTISGGRISTSHRTTVDEPHLSVVSPPRDSCVPAEGGTLIVAAELDAGATQVTARIDCGTPLALRYAGGWAYEVELPALAGRHHAITVEATNAVGTRASTSTSFVVCTPAPAPTATAADWSQLGGSPAHLGATSHELAPPLTTRWTATVGGHVVTAAPVIAGGIVYVAVTDLADGTTGGIVAVDLATGHRRWRVATQRPVRGGLAVADGTVVVPQVDGTVLGLDATSGAERWRHELSSNLPPEMGALFGAPAAERDDVFVGNQRALAVLTASAGALVWTDDPVPDGADSQSAAAVAIGEGIVVGTFNRALGGVIAWDRTNGKRLWSVLDDSTVAINASPVISRDSVYFVSGADEVSALDLAGQLRWRTKLDDGGFDWGNATIGTPALADGVLVVPTLYRDLVALDAATGTELWRLSGTPGPLRATHYRGGGEAGFAASPVIAGGIVWAVDTSGVVSALELHRGRVLWQQALGVPVLAGLAISGDWLVIASYDGTVRALAPTDKPLAPIVAPTRCPRGDELASSGCCDTGDHPATILILVLCAGAVLLLPRRRTTENERGGRAVESSGAETDGPYRARARTACRGAARSDSDPVP